MCAEMPFEDALSTGGGVLVESAFLSCKRSLKSKQKRLDEKFTPSDLQWSFCKSVMLLMPPFSWSKECLADIIRSKMFMSLSKSAVALTTSLLVNYNFQCTACFIFTCGLR